MVLYSTFVYLFVTESVDHTQNVTLFLTASQTKMSRAALGSGLRGGFRPSSGGTSVLSVWLVLWLITNCAVVGFCRILNFVIKF